MMKNPFKGRHFQKDIILVVVGYYFRFSLSYRDFETFIETHSRPNYLVTGQYGGTLKAIKQVIKDGILAMKNHQCSKYRNNLIEQDHRLIKHVLVKSSGFQSLRTALKTLSGSEVMHQLHKKAKENRVSLAFHRYNH